MLRFLILPIVVLGIYGALTLTVRWLAAWRQPRWMLVVIVVNTVLFGGIIAIADEFRRGLTLYAVYHSVVVGWLSLQAGRLGFLGLETIRSRFTPLDDR